MSGRAYFVTGTDTGVGKTVVATGLLAAAGRAGLSVVGLKPVAAGRDGHRDGVPFNADAIALMNSANVDLDYAAVNPVLLDRPVAPHIAAAEEGIDIDVTDLAARVGGVIGRNVDLAIVEGAGGWLVPLNEAETLADLCVALDLPVILVVGMRLGCLNHALLTAAAIGHAGLTLAGWVANSTEQTMDAADANIEALRARIAAPLLGCVPRLAPGTAAVDYLDFGILLND